MADMSSLDFAMMVEDTHIDTQLVEYRARKPGGDEGAGPLYAVCLTDRLADGLSLVYSFYAPHHARRSLGAFVILDHIAKATRSRPAARLSRLLGRGVEEDGIQGRLPAAGAPRPARLDPGRAVGAELPGDLLARGRFQRLRHQKLQLCRVSSLVAAHKSRSKDGRPSER